MTIGTELRHINMHEVLDVKIERPWLMNNGETWTSSFIATDVNGNRVHFDIFAPTQEALVPRVTGVERDEEG